MDLLEQLVRRQATRIVRNGEPVLITDGDPLLLEAFKALGWTDPYPLTAPAPEEAAVVEAPERAVLSRPKRRVLPEPKRSRPRRRG